ncbi:MATE family efflux transporter [Blautia sp. XA-2221]|uniref:MATE family efflux transporter n=1 Tax=Blautia sp. XA-2221 TaxID=2903961 RepID=UPI0023790809|nr:MATE family efflux transporter [Blautia sp. XA-2221]
MKTSADLGKDPVSSLVLRLAIPAMIAQFVNVLYSIIDRMYIGHIPKIGALALAGVGVCGPIVTLLLSFGTLVGLGGSILLGIRMGERDLPKARQILSNSFLMLCGFSVILTVAFLFMKDHLLIWFGASEITFPYADTYMTIYTAGTFFALMAAGLNYFINCQGFPVAGMTTVLIGAISNIILDPVFIFLFHMDVAGAAIATVISQMASCTFALLFLFSKKVHVRISFGNYSRRLMLNIIYLGMSPFLILATDSILLIVMNTVLQKYGGPKQGDMLITCATIVQSYMLLITSPMIGISGGTQAIISYNYGARQTQRVKKTVRTNLALMLMFTTFMFILSRFVPGSFVRLFTSSKEYMDFSVWGIKIFTMMIIPLSFQYVFVDALTALERTKTALSLSVLRKLLYVAGTITLPLFFQASAAFYAEPLSDFVSAVVSTAAFLLIIDRHLKKREAAVAT